MGCERFGPLLPVGMLHIQGVHQVGSPAGHGCIGQLQHDAEQHACLSHGIWQGQNNLPNLAHSHTWQ